MHKKIKRTAMIAALAVSIAVALTGCGSNTQSVFHTQAVEENAGAVTVPWDYRIVEAEVGDLIGSDMTLLPDNTLLPNDNNYATGDKVWVLQFMDAELVTDSQQRNEIRLSAWRALKSYKTEASAQEDIEKLKLELTTELDLIGVYKTEYKGETRNFAVVELPSGNRIKQPIDDAKYEELAKVKKVNVLLEEIHDFADYDLAYAKFRGWAN